MSILNDNEFDGNKYESAVTQMINQNILLKRPEYVNFFNRHTCLNSHN